MLISSVVAGIAVALLRRGHLRALAGLHFRWWWLIVVAIGLKFVLVRTPDLSPWLLAYGSALHAVVYALLLTPLVSNLRLPGMALITTGTLLNAVVIIVNGGRMPVSERTLAALGKTSTIEAIAQGRSVTHLLMDPDTVFPLLGDWIGLPPPWTAAASIGDFLLAAGVIWLINRVMCASPLLAHPTPQGASEAAVTK